MIPNKAKFDLFNQTLDLTTGAFSASLVTAAPDATIETMGQASLLSGGNYEPKTFAALPVLGLNSGEGRAIWGEAVWNELTSGAGQSAAGVLICKQLGSAPAAEDPVVAFNPFPQPFTVQGTSLVVPPPIGFRLTNTSGATFNQVILGLLNRSLALNSGDFYAHLVTSAPTPSMSTVAELSLVSGGNYSSVPLSGPTFTIQDNHLSWTTFVSVWGDLNVSAEQRIRGYVVCKRLGATNTSSDLLIAYKPLDPTRYPNGILANGATLIPSQIGVTGRVEWLRF